MAIGDAEVVLNLFQPLLPLEDDGQILLRDIDLRPLLFRVLDGVESIKQTAADTERLLNPLGLKDLNV